MDDPQPGRLPRAGQEVEVEGGVHLVGPQVAGEPLGVGHPHLADQDAGVGVGVRDPPPAAVDVVQVVPVDVRVRGHHRVGAGGRVGQVGQLRVLGDQGGGVDPHPARAAVEPEAQHVLVLGPHVGVVPVEVGLLGVEEVEEPVAGGAVRVGGPGPGGAAELRGPVVGRQFAVLAAAGPEPEPLPGRGARTGRQRLAEPRVGGRYVVGHDVDDRPDAQREGLGDQLLGLGQGAEHRVDVAVVGDVVAAVGHRRGVPGVEPQGVDAQLGQVRKAGPHAGEITGPVAVAVGEAPRIDLVDDRAAPPVLVGLGLRGVCHVNVLSGRWDPAAGP